MKQSKLNVLQPHNSLLSGTAVCCLETAYNVSLICFLLCVFISNQFFGFYIFFFFLQAQIILVSIANEGASIEL